MTGIATCGFCGEAVPLADIMAHLRAEHGQDCEVQTWPDGSPVVIDETLEPGDFGAEGTRP